MMAGTKVGEVTHFFTDISVAVLNLTEALHEGDTVRIVGNETDFEQTIQSMQVDHEDVKEGKPGQEVAVKVESRVRSGDAVYRATS